MHAMTKSPVRLGREALAVGRISSPAHWNRFSRHDFTRPHLFALPALQQFLRTDYRGLVL